MKHPARLFPILALLAAASGAIAQDWAKERVNASPRHQEWVAVKHGERTVQTFVVYPEVKEKAPVVVLIHEIFGMTDWVMLMADELAEAGFIAVAPDLLSQMGPAGGRSDSFADTGKAREMVSALLPAQVTADLNAVCDHAKMLPAFNGKLSVGGFCWGGSQTFNFATKRADLSAAYVFYGSGPTDEASLKAITAPVYGFYAGNDSRINATLEKTTEQMKLLGKVFEPVTYDGAGHGFMRAGQQPGASEPNAKGWTDAFKRWKDLLARLK